MNTDPAGNTGTATFSPMGVAYSITATQSTGTGTTEQTLASYNLPANSLDVAGRNIRITAWFHHAANTDTVTDKLYFGSEVISDAGCATSGCSTKEEFFVLKTGSNTQNVVGAVQKGANPQAPAYTAAIETDTAAITIKATATDTTSAAGDGNLVYFTVEYMN